MSEVALNPIPDDYEKIGYSARVEQTLDDALNDENRVDELLTDFRAELASDIKGVSPDKRTDEEFTRERIFGQAVTAIVNTHAIQAIFPDMTGYHQERGSLFVPEDWTWGWPADTGVLEMPAGWLPSDNPESPLIRSGRYWFTTGLNRTLTKYVLDDHPILRHLQDNVDKSTALGLAWKQTPMGKRNIMQIAPGDKITALQALPSNMHLAGNTLAAYAVHAAIFKGITKPAQLPDLLQGAREQAIPRITWYSSTHRHTAQITSEVTRRLISGEIPKLFAEKRMDEIYEILKLTIPDGGASLITPASIEKNGLEAVVRQFSDRPMARDVNFCPHASLREGPLQNARRCAGNVAFSFPEASDRAAAGAFFGQLGLPTAWGERFNPTMATLAAAYDMHRARTFPEWLVQTSGNAELFQRERQRLEQMQGNI